MSDDSSLINDRSAVCLAGVINRAASFDVAALSTEEAIEVYTLLDHLMTALWREHGRALLPMYHSLLERLGVNIDGDDDDGASGGTSH